MGNYNFELDLDSQNTMSIINNWIKAGSNVLEFGPANGRLTRYLSQEKECRVTIVELDPISGAEAAQFANESYLGEQFGDIENFYWLDTKEKFEYILFADVLEHLHNPGLVLKKCKQVLAEDGSILLSVPNLGHNSVLIALLMDRFTYGKTGLLDRTHIHFFTYQSLVQMIVDSGYHVNEIVPVYSRVGDNEIDANYWEVPAAVEMFLRKRATGSVYQFVCKIGLQDTGEDRMPFEEPFLQECHHYVEAQCFYRMKEEAEFRADGCVSKIAAADQEISASFPLPSGVHKLRFDPLDDRSIVLIQKAEVVTQRGEIIPCQIESSTAGLRINNLFVFEENDPAFFFAAFSDEQNVTEFRVNYRIMSFAGSCEYYRGLISVLRQELEGCGKVVVCENEELQQARAWSAHLEKDVAELKERIAHLEGDIAVLSESETNENEMQKAQARILRVGSKILAVLKKKI